MDIALSKKNQARNIRGREMNRGGVVDLRALAKDEKLFPKCARTSTTQKELSTKRCSDVKPQEKRIEPIVRELPQANTVITEKKAVAENTQLFTNKRNEPASHNFLRQLEQEKIKRDSASPLKRAFIKPVRSESSFAHLSLPKLERPEIHYKKSFMRFAVSSFLIPVIIFTFSFAQSQFEKKGKVLGESTAAYDNLKSAAGYAFASDFALTGENFESANLNFAKARETINGIGSGIGETVANLPIDTPLSTAQNLASAGENISLAGKDLSDMLSKVSAESTDMALLGKLGDLEPNLKSASSHLRHASENLERVDTAYIPADMREKIELAKNTLPTIATNFQRVAEDYPLISKMLGSIRPQKYLLLFENNSEMRATGGFVGSYGILDIENGKVKNLTIDGIFNPDGQLKEKIVPPMPIQKISASWSMHDANWFADYPTSAKKIALLYEKTGGPTVDGVIAVTPEAIKKLLLITGPIEMPEFGVTITADNFVAETQNQVENLYDKEENRPKKILSALAPILIERTLQSDALDQETRAAKLLGLIQVGEESLREKHILIYHQDETIESMLQKRGWGGEVIQNATGDYLSVINSNINGYKTDAVVEENIKLETEIQTNGRIINTLTIHRKHNGGNEAYDWYNRVNADYMRVYVPKGSILLESSGGTVEEYNPPMDYTSFKVDADVSAIEKTIKIDADSGTQIFEEAGKTVFGNWVYVSPQEEVTVVYKYELPFRVDFASNEVDSYSAIIQKQSGSIGSGFESSIRFPDEWQAAWKTTKIEEGNKVSEKLTKDMLYAFVFIKK